MPAVERSPARHLRTGRRRPAHLGHRPLQLPLHLLHAGRGAPVAPEGRTPHVRGAHAAPRRSSCRLGVRSLKITGGEPTSGPTCPILARMFRKVGPDLDISITTNGLLLDKLATPLAEAGVDRATVSCDSLLRHRFEEMTRRDALDRVLRGPGGRGGRRPHAHQDQHRGDRRHERRRGRRLRPVGARDGLRGPVHRVHAARRPARVGAREGRSRRSHPRGHRRGLPTRARRPDERAGLHVRLRRRLTRAGSG